MDFFKRMLSDGEYPSLSRWLAFTCIPPLVFIPLIVWVCATSKVIKDGKMAEMSGTIIGFMSAAGTLIAGNYYLAKRQETQVEIHEKDKNDETN